MLESQTRVHLAGGIVVPGRPNASRCFRPGSHRDHVRDRGIRRQFAGTERVSRRQVDRKRSSSESGKDHPAMLRIPDENFRVEQRMVVAKSNWTSDDDRHVCCHMCILQCDCPNEADLANR